VLQVRLSPRPHGAPVTFFVHRSMVAPGDKTTTPKVDKYCITLTSQKFNPEKYEALLKLLCQQYKMSGDPTSILQGFLCVFTTGAFSNAAVSFGAHLDACQMCHDTPTSQNAFQGDWSGTQYQDMRAYISGCSIQVNSTLSRNTAHPSSYLSTLSGSYSYVRDGIRTALECACAEKASGGVLRRCHPAFARHTRLAPVRVAPAGSDDVLLRMIRLLSCIACAQDWNILHPYVTAKKNEVLELQNVGVYVAGFVDSGVRSSEQLYDVFVDGTGASCLEISLF
jgi:hypothetical protein